MAKSDGERWFDWYCEQVDAGVSKPAAPGIRHACPCCRFLTLDERGGYSVCPVCYWEDDGQDDRDADVVRGGPNGGLSLTLARSNFARMSACDEKFCNLVRPPAPEELPA